MGLLRGRPYFKTLQTENNQLKVSFQVLANISIWQLNIHQKVVPMGSFGNLKQWGTQKWNPNIEKFKNMVHRLLWRLQNMIAEAWFNLLILEKSCLPLKSSNSWTILPKKMLTEGQFSIQWTMGKVPRSTKQVWKASLVHIWWPKRKATSFASGYCMSNFFGVLATEKLFTWKQGRLDPGVDKVKPKEWYWIF